MKRGAPLRNKTPMQRTGTLRTAAATKAANLTRAPSEKKPAKARARMKSTRPKMTPIRRSARGEACTLMIPGICTNDTSTTVLCHSNRLEDGKGLGLKTPDTEACYGCSACHDVLDGRRPRPSWLSSENLQMAFDRARTNTQRKLKEKGLM
jgi:hypothetical protein